MDICRILCAVVFSLFVACGIVGPILTGIMSQKTRDMAPVYGDYPAHESGYQMFLFTLPGLLGLILTKLGVEGKVLRALWVINFLIIAGAIAVACSLLSSFHNYTDCREVGLSCKCSSDSWAVTTFSTICADVKPFIMVVKCLKAVAWMVVCLSLYGFFCQCCLLGEKEKCSWRKTLKKRTNDLQRSNPEPNVNCISQPTTTIVQLADVHIRRAEPNPYAEFPSCPATNEANTDDGSSHIYEELKF